MNKYLGGHISTRSAPKDDQSYTTVNPGPFIGIVKDNRDINRMGALTVNIPSLSGSEDPPEESLITVQYLAPFYGSKSPNAVRPSGIANYEDSQHSYGFWAVPPDIDSKVLVIFAEGNMTQGFWIGCVQDTYTNHMVPGIAASEDTFSPASAGDFSLNKEQIYGTGNLPAGEANRTLYSEASQQGVDRLKKPIHPFAETLRQQGLVQDNVRGTTSSSARRESPSRVFGFSTPGRESTLSSKTDKLGPKNAKRELKTTRLAGHTFTMDDGDVNGDNQLVRLRTASGHQLLMNDSAGVVYIANGSGNAWMEFAANGAIDIYAGGSVSMRSAGDMNFHSDGNINMFAKNQIKMSSVSKMVLDALAIQQHADFDIQLQATGGSITAKSPTGSIISYAGQQQIHMASGQTHLTGSQVHFNSIGTNPNIVKTYERTSALDFSGTGTKRELYPDVIPSEKYKAQPLTVTQNGNVTMSGMRMPTHEPYPFHFDKVVSFYGAPPSVNDNIPGTANFIAQRNRTSSNDTIRFGQFQADLQKHLEDKGLGQVPTAVNKSIGSKVANASVEAIRKVADEFTKDYSGIYGLPQNTLNPITPLTSGVPEVVNQTISVLTGDKKVGSLLKDQVFVRQNGGLYTGNAFDSPVVGNVKTVLDTITDVAPIYTTAGAYATVGKIAIGAAEGAYQIVKDPKGAAINAATSIVTNSFKNTVGGQVTAASSISSVLNTVGAGVKTAVASVTKAVGSIFKW